MRKIASHLVLTPQGLKPNRVVTLTDDGTVVAIEECASPDRCEGVEWYGGVLIPGMVNAHCHLELSMVRGAVRLHAGFSGFAHDLREARAAATEEQARSSAEYWDSAMWQSGVQAVGDVCNSNLTFALKSRSAIRYHNFVELYGLGRRDTSAVEGVLAEARNMGLAATITPHSLYSLSDEAYTAAAADERLSVHFAESDEEMGLFEQKGAMWEWYQSAGFCAPFIGRYASPAERLVALTPTERQMVLVHACRASADDIRMVESHFTRRPVWVVCPRSNDFISELTPPTRALVECDSRVAIGTDSLASNHSLSMIEEIAAMPEVPLEMRLRWATRGGAEALGMERELGSFEVGLRSGAVIVEGVDFASMQLRGDATTRRIV